MATHGKWSYKIVDMTGDLPGTEVDDYQAAEDLLNLLGAEGWELTMITGQVRGTVMSAKWAWFKRPSDWAPLTEPINAS